MSTNKTSNLSIIPQPVECEYFCTKAAAIFLGVSTQFLEAARLTPGAGPDYLRLSRRVRYPRHSLIAWAEARVVKQHASK